MRLGSFNHGIDSFGWTCYSGLVESLFEGVAKQRLGAENISLHPVLPLSLSDRSLKRASHHPLRNFSRSYYASTNRSIAADYSHSLIEPWASSPSVWSMYLILILGLISVYKFGLQFFCNLIVEVTILMNFPCGSFPVLKVRIFHLIDQINWRLCSARASTGRF